MSFFIKENSRIARFAAWKLNSTNVAIVVGKTIHLYGATTNDLLGNKRWLRHEMAHIRQFRKYGFLTFILLYLWESLRHGYKHNRFEREAREKENDTIRFSNAKF